MKKHIILLITLGMVFSTFSGFSLASDTSDSTEKNVIILDIINVVYDGEDITIDDPEPGFVYFLNNGKRELPVLSVLDYSIVVYENLKIYATANGVDHVKFVVKRILTGEETVIWDYDLSDGFSSIFNMPSGRYYVSAIAYDDAEQMLSSDSTKILFINFGQSDSEDFGVWVRTMYNGAVHNEKLGIGLIDFKQMLDEGSSKEIDITLDSEDDTTIDIGFSRTQIIVDGGDTVDVIQTQLQMDTSCDTFEDHEVALEVRFPFSVLQGDSDSTVSGEPYFSVRAGYASPENDHGPSSVHARFFFGKESLADPAVFRMHITPNNLEDGPVISYFNSYTTKYSTGEEVFHRGFSVDFEPAVDLEVTSIPGEGKIGYRFYDSAGADTKISFKAEGGLLDNIVQSFSIDPLPSSMAFDLTLIGERSFLYESSESYDVTYALESEINGELVKIVFDDLPETISATRNLDILEGLSASGFVDLDMSSDITGVSLFLRGSEYPFLDVANFPKKMRLDGFIDLDALEGSIEFMKDYDDVPTITTSVAFDRWVISDTVTLESEYVRMFCDLGPHVTLGIDTNENVIIRDNEFTVYDRDLDDNVFELSFVELETDDFQLSWDNDGAGHISNFNWFGGIKKLRNLQISVNNDGDLFDISGNWDLLTNGSFNLILNKDVNLSFDGIENSLFKISGYLDVAAGRELHIGWDWNDNGYFIMESTGGYFGRKAGILFECIWNGEDEYLYGVSITAQNFPDKYRKIWWDNENGLHVWITGGLLPVDWQIDVKVDGEWLNQGSFEYV